ncbi:hypothetical protein [Propioniciclava soli]|uniref:hypothetical protein n=1 Tax=Propioniciclava soli TaxID=2775081 RepID=UPI001E3D0666|nr:hypothetical protein [Propioniciclava soli]
MLLRINHAPDSYRAEQTTWCIAMDLTLSHVIYWQKVIDGVYEHHTGRRERPVDPHEAQARDFRRAEQVWRHRLDDLHQALTAAGISPAPTSTQATFEHIADARQPHPEPSRSNSPLPVAGQPI